MEYHFTQRFSAKYSVLYRLYDEYTHPIGVINLVFCASFLALMVSFLLSGKMPPAMLSFLAAAYFPLGQPILMYVRFKKQGRNLMPVELTINEQGIHGQTEGKDLQTIPWSRIKAVRKTPWHLVLAEEKGRGLVLNREIFKDRAEAESVFLFAGAHASKNH